MTGKCSSAARGEIIAAPEVERRSNCRVAIASCARDRLPSLGGASRLASARDAPVRLPNAVACRGISPDTNIVAEFLDLVADGVEPRDDVRFGPVGPLVVSHRTVSNLAWAQIFPVKVYAHETKLLIAALWHTREHD